MAINLKTDMNASIEISGKLETERDELKHKLESAISELQECKKMKGKLDTNNQELTYKLQVQTTILEEMGKENSLLDIEVKETNEKFKQCQSQLNFTEQTLEQYQNYVKAFKLTAREKEARLDKSVSIVEEEAKKIYGSLEEKCKEVEVSKKELIKYKARTYHLTKEKMKIQYTFNLKNGEHEATQFTNNTVANKSNEIACLWLTIDEMHLTCLRTNKSTAAHYQNLIENKVYQYLTLVPHEQRFCYSQVWEILLLSAKMIPNFSPMQAAKAFKLIEKFAGNLLQLNLEHYSRTEFKKTFIEKHLYGAKELFLQMGYQYISTGENVLVLDTPVDKDCIVSVARDCRVGQTECRIINDIFRSVADQCPCTWKEVFDCRLNYTGTPQQASNKLLKCRKRHSV
jgi:dihydroneopterin aldolase